MVQRCSAQAPCVRAQRAAGNGRGMLSSRRPLSLGLHLEVNCVQKQCEKWIWTTFYSFARLYSRLGSLKDLPVHAGVHLRGLRLMITQTMLQWRNGFGLFCFVCRTTPLWKDVPHSVMYHRYPPEELFPYCVSHFEPVCSSLHSDTKIFGLCLVYFILPFLCQQSRIIKNPMWICWKKAYQALL